MLPNALLFVSLFSPPTSIAPPATPPDYFVESIDHVDVIGTDTAAEFVAYDNDDNPIGVVSIHDPSEGVRIDYEFDDGWASFVRHADGTVTVDSTLDVDAIESRLSTIIDTISAGGPETAEFLGEATCAIALLPTIEFCNPKNPNFIRLCPPSILASMCACRDIVEERFGVELDQKYCKPARWWR